MTGFMKSIRVSTSGDVFKDAEEFNSRTNEHQMLITHKGAGVAIDQLTGLEFNIKFSKESHNDRMLIQQNHTSRSSLAAVFVKRVPKLPVVDTTVKILCKSKDGKAVEVSMWRDTDPIEEDDMRLSHSIQRIKRDSLDARSTEVHSSAYSFIDRTDWPNNDTTKASMTTIKNQDFMTCHENTTSNKQYQQSNYSNADRIELHNTKSVMVDMIDADLDLSSDWDGDL